MSDDFSVVLDACVLVDALKRNILLSLAEYQCFRPILSDTILTEFAAAGADVGYDGPKQRARIEAAFPGAVADPAYIHIVGQLQMRDPDDRHVVAVAMQEHADAIVTDNVRDFTLATVEVLTPDQFIADTLDLHRENGLGAIRAMRGRLMRTFSAPDDLILAMRARGLNESADFLEIHSTAI